MVENINKDSIPTITDRIDYHPWKTVVMELVDTIKEREDSVYMKQNLIQAMRQSAKKVTVKEFSRLLQSNSLEYIIRRMEKIMGTKHGILRDLKLRLDNMPDVEDRAGTCESARKVRQMIQVLQGTNSIGSVDPIILDLLIRKSCSQSQRIDFESYFYKGLNKSTKE